MNPAEITAAVKAKRLTNLLSTLLTDYPVRLFLMAGTSQAAMRKALPALNFEKPDPLAFNRAFERDLLEACGIKIP